MPPLCIHDRAAIARYLLRNQDIHLYELGDLDDFFWQYTTWYASCRAGEITDLALLYTGTDLPILLASAPEHGSKSSRLDLLNHLLPFLPRRFYSHLSEGLEAAFTAQYHLTSHGLHLKMTLKNVECLPPQDARVQPLASGDLPVLQDLYASSYPDNWFDPRMLETGQYFGIWRDGQLISAAGVHVYSPQYRVAALGNITTRPEYRGMGLGTLVTAKLCHSLLNNVDHIGLNVRADNAPAIAIYRKIGFEPVTQYTEWMAIARTGISN